MTSCPRCEAHTSSGSGCRVCNETLDPMVRTDGGRGPNDRRNQQPGGQGGRQGQPQGGRQGQPQGGRQGQPQGGRQGGQQRGRQQGGPPSGGRRGQGGDDGFSRRQLLIGGGGGIAVLGGVWFFFLNDDGGSTDSPEAVVEASYSAIDDGDIDRLNELYHADSPEGEIQESDFAAAGASIEDIDYTVESTQTVDEDINYEASEYDNVQEFETVEVEFTVSFEGQENTSTTTIIVAKNSDGEWKIWE